MKTRYKIVRQEGGHVWVRCETLEQDLWRGSEGILRCRECNDSVRPEVHCIESATRRIKRAQQIGEGHACVGGACECLCRQALPRRRQLSWTARRYRRCRFRTRFP